MKRIRWLFFSTLLSLLMPWLCRAQTPINGVVIISVSNSPTNITVDRTSYFVAVRENAASPTAVFSITITGTSVAQNFPAGAVFIFNAPNGQPFQKNQTIGTIVATASGPFTFTATESTSAPPSMQAKVGTGGSNGSGVTSVSGAGGLAVTNPTTTPTVTASGACLGVTPACVDATTMSGADMSIKIEAAIEASYLLSTTSVHIAADGFTGPQTWSENPMAVAAANGKLATTGVITICQAGTIDAEVPIVHSNYWSIKGCTTPSGAAQAANHFQADTTLFPKAYSTGTVTFGTAGYEEAVTGLGTTFTANMVGCLIVAPGGQPTNANSSWGVIHTFTSATSVTLGWGQNNGTGASSGATFQIECPLILQGDGHLSSAGGGPFMSGMRDSALSLDCNNVAGCISLANYFGNELTSADYVNLEGFQNIGFDMESGYAQDAGPYGPGILSTGSTCSSATIPVVIRTGYVANRPFDGWSLGGCSGTDVGVGVDMEGSFGVLKNIHIEGAITGILVNGGVNCPYTCPSPHNQTGNVLIENVQTSLTGTTVVQISNAGGSSYGGVLLDISRGNNWSNAVVDTQNSCTETNNQIAYYTLDSFGNIGQSASQIQGCMSSPNINNLTVRGSLAADSGISTGGTVSIGGKVQQNVSGQFAGSCAMSTGTTCTFTLNGGNTFTNWICFATQQGTGTPVVGASSCSFDPSTSIVTVTATTANSATWAAAVYGNPY